MGGCTVVPERIDADTGVVSGADPVACAPADAVSFEWATSPPMTAQVDSAPRSCTLGQVVREAGALNLPMLCAGEGAEPARAVTLTLWATPEPPTRALVAGAAVRLTELSDGAQAWLRLEDEVGAPLVVAAAAAGLTPPDEASWWSPFLLMPAATTCLADETACDARRTGVDVRRSGGPPVVVQDAGWRVVGDKGEAQLWVASAWSQDAGCADGPGTWFIAGLVAAR